MDALVTILCGLAVIAVAGAAVWFLVEARKVQKRDREQQQALRTTGGNGDPPEPP
jgi:hypothetical protein